MNPAAVGRLEALARLSGRGLRALWLETLPPEQSLGEVSGSRDALSLLQKVRSLLELGREADARGALEELGALPPGLARVRDELSVALACRESSEPTEDAAGLASPTLAELHARQGDRDAAAAMYREVLKQDPTDAQARGRLAELTGIRAAGPEQALTRWLEGVRRWRSAHCA